VFARVNAWVSKGPTLSIASKAKRTPRMRRTPTDNMASLPSMKLARQPSTLGAHEYRSFRASLPLSLFLLE
jgi:hypothetical protein